MVKCVVKLKNCQIGTKIGVIVDIDPVIMLTKRQKDKKTKMQKCKKAKRQKYKNTKRQKGNKTKIQKSKGQKDKKTKKKGPNGPPHPPQELDQGGQQPHEVLVMVNYYFNLKIHFKIFGFE